MGPVEVMVVRGVGVGVGVGLVMALLRVVAALVVLRGGRGGRRGRGGSSWGSVHWGGGKVDAATAATAATATATATAAATAYTSAAPRAPCRCGLGGLRGSLAQGWGGAGGVIRAALQAVTLAGLLLNVPRSSKCLRGGRRYR